MGKTTQFQLDMIAGYHAVGLDTDYVHGTSHFSKSNSVEAYESRRPIEQQPKQAVPARWMAL